MLVAKGRKIIHTATPSEKGETVIFVACMSTSGRNWILPMVLCKGKHRSMRVK
jgi:hypothetical protein